MANNPQYVGTPKSPTVALSTANANRDGVTGAYGTLMTAGASGSRIDGINIAATGTTTAGMIRLFLGSSLIKEVSVSAITPSGTLAAFSYPVTFDPPLVLQAGAVLKASTHNAEGFALAVTNGGDF